MQMAPREELTKRQKQFLAMVGKGKLNQEIASIFNLSSRTVENTISQARTRLKARTTAQCILIAIAREELGLTHEGDCFVPDNLG
jgi:DNA-binding NarL/FixJ family response regulator